MGQDIVVKKTTSKVICELFQAMICTLWGTKANLGRSNVTSGGAGVTELAPELGRRYRQEVNQPDTPNKKYQ